MGVLLQPWCHFQCTAWALSRAADTFLVLTLVLALPCPPRAVLQWLWGLPLVRCYLHTADTHFTGVTGSFQRCLEQLVSLKLLPLSCSSIKT